MTADTSTEAPLIIPPPAPKRGEEITIIRPGAAAVRMRFLYLDPLMPAASPGWLWLAGEVQEDHGPFGGWWLRTMYARPLCRGVYQMIDRPK